MNAADPDRTLRPPVRWLNRLVAFVVRHAVHFATYGVVSALVVIITLAVVFLNRRPNLEVWHTAYLDAEFTRDSPITSFDEYLALEDTLFKQLEDRVYAKVPAKDDSGINRYRRGSVSDPGRWPTNWNRSFVREVPEPKRGVLLIHGMSDSPYSMRTLADALHADGATVVGMRAPGHGTAPSGLLRVEWEDMAAAVELAVRYVRDNTGDAPLYIVGYSNGGALAVHYALSALKDESLPRAEGLVLFSPEIGITKMAALAVWQERLGRWLGLPKLAWNSISLEYDPFQYGSFAVNAGNQAYRLTKAIQAGVADAVKRGNMHEFPRVLAFQSAVDATVLPEVLVTALFMHLSEAGGHELVLFDVNQVVASMEVLKNDPADAIARLSAMPDLPFMLTLVTNESAESERVVARRRGVGEKTFVVKPLDAAWPGDVYSLAHIALPFPPDDPVYGGPDAAPSPGIKLGVAVWGERGCLDIPAAELLRMHWNPFHAHVTQRMLEFVATRPVEGEGD